jgi:hypothetical protein
MRQCIPAPRSDTATCAQCGKVGPGLFWENRLKVLDFGVSGFPPIEPDTTAPVRCDRCETVARVTREYQVCPQIAAHVYGSATATEALMRLMQD